MKTVELMWIFVNIYSFLFLNLDPFSTCALEKLISTNITTFCDSM